MAEIVTLPLRAFAVTFPFLETVAIFLFEDFQVILPFFFPLFLKVRVVESLGTKIMYEVDKHVPSLTVTLQVTA